MKHMAYRDQVEGRRAATEPEGNGRNRLPDHGWRAVLRPPQVLGGDWHVRRADGRLGRGEPRDILQVRSLGLRVREQHRVRIAVD